MSRILKVGMFFSFTIVALATCAQTNARHNELQCFKNAYPDQIQSISNQSILWKDGTTMPLQNTNAKKTTQEKLDNPELYDQIHNVFYTQGIPSDTQHFAPQDDPGRIRYLPFFQKMYGHTEDAVKTHLVTMYWMPHYFNKKYPLQVTTVNGVNQKVVLISDALEKLVAEHPHYLNYLKEPGGTFMWRVIANTDRISPHSFGMTLDINAPLSNYWQWDLEKEKKPITEETALNYRNDIPWEIVDIFEKNGFIWGGKWRHYDSMHFEYRPELLVDC